MLCTGYNSIMQISFIEYSSIIKIEIFFCGIHVTYFDQLWEVKNTYNNKKIELKNSREPCFGECNSARKIIEQLSNRRKLSRGFSWGWCLQAKLFVQRWTPLFFSWMNFEIKGGNLKAFFSSIVFSIIYKRPT